MPTNHTANYNLNQWVKSDQVKMEDFNADNAKIDAAIKGAHSLAAGKADLSALNAEISARTAAVNAETSARTAAVNTLNTAISKRGNCQIYTFSYTGNGGEQSFTFPEKPLLVLLVSALNGYTSVCVYGSERVNTLGTDVGIFSVTWTENTLSFYSNRAINAPNSDYLGVAFFARD